MNNLTNISCTRTTRMQKLTVFYLLLYPIISIYGWPSLGFGFVFDIFLVGYFVYNRFKLGRKLYTNKIPKLLWVYLLYWYITSFIHAQNTSEIISLGVILTIFLCLVFYEEIKGDYFVKMYRFTATVILFYYYIQVVVLKTTGVLLKGVTTLLPINFLSSSSAGTDLETWYEHNEIGMRPSSFFTEPAMMAQFLLPLLCIELFSAYKDYRRAAVLGLTIVLLQSGNGYFGLLAVGLAYGIHLLFGNQTFKKKFISSVVILVSAFSGIFFIGTEMGQKVMERQDTILDYDNTHGQSWGYSSAFYRMYRGYYIIEGMSDVDKVLGIGNSLVLLKKAEKNNSFSYTFEANDTYMNTIQSILVKTGVFGFLLMLIFSIVQWRKVGILGKSSLLVLLVLSLMSSTFFTTSMMILLLIPWLEEKKILVSETNL